MSEALHTITLRDTLPQVFIDSPSRPSQIWRREVAFTPPGHYIIEAASGTGKSSLCAYLYGARQDYDGKIYFNNTDISTYSIDDWLRLRRDTLAYLPQELDLFPELTARENILLKQRLTAQPDIPTIQEWMHKLGIADRADFPVGKMSIGQQQRVAIIRALCQPFRFLLLDEPVSHLDTENNLLAAEIILQEATRQGAAIIATSVGNPLMIPDAPKLEL